MTISVLMQMAESSQNGYKILWEKGKVFVTNNFSFFHSVFKRSVQQTRKNHNLLDQTIDNNVESSDWIGKAISCGALVTETSGKHEYVSGCDMT